MDFDNKDAKEDGKDYVDDDYDDDDDAKDDDDVSDDGVSDDSVDEDGEDDLLPCLPFLPSRLQTSC